MALSDIRFKLNEDVKLKDKKLINYIFRQGNKKPQKTSVLFYVESSSFKFLIAFKKRILNPAKRNKLKRHIKEYVRLNRHRLKKIDCAILIVKVPSSKNQLLQELEFLLIK